MYLFFFCGKSTLCIRGLDENLFFLLSEKGIKDKKVCSVLLVKLYYSSTALDHLRLNDEHHSIEYHSFILLLFCRGE